MSNSGCFATTSFTVKLSQTPNTNTPNSIFVCDDATNDGKEICDVGNVTAIVLGAQSSNQYEVSYHFNQNDADTNSNLLELNYQNSSNPQTIYARITNKQNTNCFATTSFQIGVNKMPVAYQPQNLSLCEDKSNVPFDLTKFNNTYPTDSLIEFEQENIMKVIRSVIKKT